MGNKRKFSSRRASFLKVLDGDFSKKLGIPSTFTKNFNGDIPHWFVLEIAGTRKGWRVDTGEDENGEYYFDYGWKEFKVEQCLEAGDYLLFEYEEPLVLQVKIFEKDGTEKCAETKVDLECDVEGSVCKKQFLKMHRVEEAHLWSTSLTNEYEAHEKSQDVTNRIEMETDDQYGMHDNYLDVTDKIEVTTDYNNGMLQKQFDINDMTMSEIDDQCRVHEKQVENFDRVERERGTGKVFATEHGVCYTITWRKTPHLYYYMTIPRAMLRGKIISNNESVILKDQEGNTWPMQLRTRPGGRVDLVKGWKEFLIENEVRNGNILTFEFVSDKVIEIYIERAFERLNPIDPPYERACPLDPPFERVCPLDPPFERAYPIDPPSERVNKREPTVSFDYTSEQPAVNYAAADHTVPETRGKIERVLLDDFTKSSFSVTWKHSTRGSYLHIPKAIAIKQKLKNDETIHLCDPEGKQWPMKLATRPSDGRVGIRQGWSTFWKQHKISYGDTLIFEFVSDHMMKVNIIKAVPGDPSLTEGHAMKQEVIQL